MVDEPISRDDVWEQVHEQSKQIGEVRSGQAAFDARIGALESAVDTGFRTLSAELRNLSERVNKPATPNYGIYVAITFGLLGMFGGYALLITNPLADSIQKNYSQVVELQEHRQRTAKLEARMNLAEAEITEGRAFRSESQFIHGHNRGHLESIERRVDDIDNHGSRFWNQRNAPDQP